MPVDSVNGAGGLNSSDPANASGAQNSPTSGANAVDPNSDTSDEVTQAAIQTFLPTMISNSMRMHSLLFDYVKQTLDDQDG